MNLPLLFLLYNQVHNRFDHPKEAEFHLAIDRLEYLHLQKLHLRLLPPLLHLHHQNHPLLEIPGQ